MSVEATDCVAKMTMDVMPQEVKEVYVELVFGYIHEVNDKLYDIAGTLQVYLIKKNCKIL